MINTASGHMFVHSTNLYGSILKHFEIETETRLDADEMVATSSSHEVAATSSYCDNPQLWQRGNVATWQLSLSKMSKSFQVILGLRMSEECPH